MKSKLTGFVLTACIAFIVLAPSLLLYGLIWYGHSNVIHASAIAPIPSILGETNAVLENTTVASLSPGSCSFSTSTVPIEQSPLSQTSATLLHIAISGILLGCFLLPIGMQIGMVVRQRYRHHRATLLRVQVANLERLWQRSIQP